MKTKIYFLLFFFTALFGNAKPINETAAKLVAKNFITNKISESKINSKTEFLLVYKESTEQNSNSAKTIVTNYFYIFSIGGNSFVIISADDRVSPILGYSLTNNFKFDNMPSNIKYLLDGYKQEIENAITNNTIPSAKIINEWNVLKNAKSKSILTNASSAIANVTNAVNPLLQTFYNQSPYYNQLCPSGSLTGCVATAMAQTMKYWNYPDQGAGSHSYTHPTYGILAADFGATTYQWDDMPNYLDNANSAVATLMYHCGVSVNMDYSPSLSGAFMSDALNSLKTYFKYDLSAQQILKSSYTDATWITTIENELNYGRPVIYAGSNSSLSGHAWVCDGYDTIDLLHFNWGWGGNNNGYFQINNHTYLNFQLAIIGIKPLNFSGVRLALNVLDSSVDLCSQPNQTINLAVPNSIDFQSFQWIKDGVNITGATSSTYIVNFNDAGSKIYCTGLNATGVTFISNKLTITQSLPTATFATAKTGLTVNFTNNSTCTNSQTWDFGDGTTSTAVNPSHTYSSLGVYNVCLTNTNGVGSKQYCEYIPFYTNSLIDEMNNICYGVKNNISYNNGQCSQAVKFTRNDTTDYTQNTSIKYPYNLWIPRKGTLEFLVNVTNGSTSVGANASNAYLLDLGSNANFHNYIKVFSNGRIEVSRSSPGYLATFLVANTSLFTFNQWHVFSISYGNLGTKIAVDGVVCATNTAVNYNLINEDLIVGHFNYYGTNSSTNNVWYGFEGLLDRFRISNSQNDFQLNTLVTSPTFAQVAPICKNEILNALPTISNNNISGAWSPVLNNTVTTTYTFIPTFGQCASNSTMTINVKQPINPIFTQVPPICIGDIINPLPTSYTNPSTAISVYGTWSPPINNTITTTYTFTPNSGECARTKTMTITVNETLAPTALTNQSFVQGQTLSNISINGSNIIWYANQADAQNKVNSLPLNTVLANGSSYFATQTINGCQSTAIAITTSVTLSNQQFNEVLVNFYPNPVKDNLYISNTESLQLDNIILIYDVQGRLIQQTNALKSNDNLVIDMQNLSSGLYFVQLQSKIEGTKIKTIKIVKE